jgi:MFS superfamily sulfate permease-like transporter
MLYLAPLLGLMPKATLAAVLVATTVGLVKPKELKAIAGVRKREFGWALVALVGVLAFGTQNGILLAVGISLLHLMYEANNPDVYQLRRKPGTAVFRPVAAEHPEDESIPGMLIVRAEGRMTFASAPNAGERLWELIRAERPQVVLLDCSAIPDIEYTALRMLENFERNLARAGMSLWLAELNPEPFRSISKIGLGATLGPQRMHHTIENAVRAHLGTGDTGTAKGGST